MDLLSVLQSEPYQEEVAEVEGVVEDHPKEEEEWKLSLHCRVQAEGEEAAVVVAEAGAEGEGEGEEREVGQPMLLMSACWVPLRPASRRQPLLASSEASGLRLGLRSYPGRIVKEEWEESEEGQGFLSIPRRRGNLLALRGVVSRVDLNRELVPRRQCSAVAMSTAGEE